MHCSALLQALDKLASKPPKQPLLAAPDSGSDVSDVEVSESGESEDEETPSAARRRRRQQGNADVAMSEPLPLPFAAAAAAAAPQLLEQVAAAEHWEVFEPLAEDSGEEWGGQKRGRGRGKGRRGRKKESKEAKDAGGGGSWEQRLPPRQRLAVRALAAAASGVAAEDTLVAVLQQAQRQAAQAHAAFSPAVPNALLVPADSPDAPTLGVATAGGNNGDSSRAGGTIAVLLARRPVGLSGIRVPSAAPSFRELTELPRYRRNLESHRK